MLDIGFSVVPSLVGGWGGEPLHARLWGLRLMEHYLLPVVSMLGLPSSQQVGEETAQRPGEVLTWVTVSGEASIISALMHCQNSGKWHTKYVPRCF